MADKLESWLREIRALRAEPHGDATKATLRTALAKRPGAVVGAAARHIAEHELRDLAPDLVGAYFRLVDGGVKLDGGCAGKQAVIEALSALDHPDAGPFLHGVELVQHEKSWGPPVDTAANLRGHALMAMVGLGTPGTPERIATLLADPEPRPRAAAAQCAVAWGDPELGRALLVLRVGAGETDPDVLAECFDGLIRLGAAERVTAHLTAADPTAESAALALGAAKVPGAVPALIAWLGGLVDPTARKVGLVALGLTRTPEALDFLLEELASAGRGAPAVLEALGVFLAEPAARARIAEVAAAAGVPMPD